MCGRAYKYRKNKRGYAKIIDDYSAKSIKPLFEEHIDKQEQRLKQINGQLTKNWQKNIKLRRKKAIQLRTSSKCTL